MSKRVLTRFLAALASLVLALLLSLLAGYLTARLVPRRPMTHALSLGLVQLTLGLSVQLQHWADMPVLYHGLFLGCILPGHLLGGRLAVAGRARD